jgi:hypothetical protein
MRWRCGCVCLYSQQTAGTSLSQLTLVRNEQPNGSFPPLGDMSDQNRGDGNTEWEGGHDAVGMHNLTTIHLKAVRSSTRDTQDLSDPDLAEEMTATPARKRLF